MYILNFIIALVLINLNLKRQNSYEYINQRERIRKLNCLTQKLHKEKEKAQNECCVVSSSFAFYCLSGSVESKAVFALGEFEFLRILLRTPSLLSEVNSRILQSFLGSDLIMAPAT